MTTTFNVGDTVNVLQAAHLPREVVSSTGVIERITYQSSDGTPLYWVSSRRAAVTARQLRPTHSEQPADWVWHDIKCAHRRFGSERGACDCGYTDLITAFGGVR